LNRRQRPSTNEEKREKKDGKHSKKKGSLFLRGHGEKMRKLGSEHSTQRMLARTRKRPRSENKLTRGPKKRGKGKWSCGIP